MNKGDKVYRAFFTIKPLDIKFATYSVEEVTDSGFNVNAYNTTLFVHNAAKNKFAYISKEEAFEALKKRNLIQTKKLRKDLSLAEKQLEFLENIKFEDIKENEVNYDNK